MPEITSPSAAFGALYVMEGSTLGGTIIAKRVREELDLQEEGVKFFSGYKNDTGRRWKFFKDKLTEYSVSRPQEEDTVIASACDTFEKLSRWFKNC